MAYAPLSGVRVLEWARDAPGPHAGRKLADLGAEVVRLAEVAKQPRSSAPSEYAAQWWPVLDRNKLSVALDFSCAEDLERLGRLVNAADVIIEGARPGAFTAKTGIDFRELRSRRPESVICSVSGFGQTGPWARRAAHGLNLESLSGCFYPERRDGRWTVGPSANLVTAVELAPVNAALAITAAVMHSRATGEGVWIDISCHDAAVEAYRHRLSAHLSGRAPFDVSKIGPRYDVFDARDGRPVFFTAADPHFWTNFCRGVGREDLIERGKDPLAAATRAEGEAEQEQHALRAELEQIFMTASAAEWDQRFQDWNSCGSSIAMSLQDLVDQEHFQARGLVMQVGDAAYQLADPIRWVDDDSRPGQNPRFPASIGADTNDVLGRWLEVADTDDP